MEDSSIQRSSLVTAIVWHPVRKILAIGWQSGDLLIWNEHDHELHEASSIHQSAVLYNGVTMGTDLSPLTRYLLKINAPLRGGLLLWYDNTSRTKLYN